MPVTSERHEAPDVIVDSDAILARARTGTRLMTIRGAIMRAISVGSNLWLLLLVSPAELGLLAVARGTFALVQYLAELGIAKALLRRPAAPTDREYAALAGLQLLVSGLVVVIGAVWAAPILGFGAIDRQWHWAMLGTVATMASLAFGTGARIRLERSLSYERLAKVDVFNVLTLNVGLIAFALLGRFSMGVFVILGVATVAANALLYRWAPGPTPSLDLRPLSAVARQSSGFLLASTCAVLREQGTPVLIGGLFGLPVAGLYSFAERVAQVLNIAFDGFRNASIPAAARLAHDVKSLKALASRTLAGSATLTAPLALLAICGLPLLALVVPKWTDAVLLTQWYVVSYAIYGVLGASMEPAAVASRGAHAAIVEQTSALAAGWLAFVAVRWMGAAYLPLAVAVMYAVPLLALFLVTTESIRPVVDRNVTQIAIGFAVTLLTYCALRLLMAPIWVTSIVPPLLMIIAVPRLRALPSQVLARWRVQDATRV